MADGDTPQPGSLEGGTQNQRTTDGDENFVGSYKTKEAAEEGIAERNRYVEQVTAERDQARAKTEQLQGEVLVKLAASQEAAAAPKGPTPEQEAAEQERQAQALVEELADAYKEDEVKGSRKALQIMSRYSADAKAAAAQQIEDATKAMENKLAASIGEVQKTLAERDPDILQHGDTAEKMAVAAGVDYTNPDVKAAFIGLAKATAKETEHPERAMLPGGAPATRTVTGNDAPFLSEYEKAALASTGMRPVTAEEEKALKQLPQYQSQ